MLSVYRVLVPEHCMCRRHYQNIPWHDAPFCDRYEQYQAAVNLNGLALHLAIQ